MPGSGAHRGGSVRTSAGRNVTKLSKPGSSRRYQPSVVPCWLGSAGSKVSRPLKSVSSRERFNRTRQCSSGAHRSSPSRPNMSASVFVDGGLVDDLGNLQVLVVVVVSGHIGLQGVVQEAGLGAELKGVDELGVELFRLGQPAESLSRIGLNRHSCSCGTGCRRAGCHRPAGSSG